MSTQAIVASTDPLLAIQSRPLPPDRHPAHVYIARLGSGSRRTMSEALNTIAAVVTSGRANLETMPWAALRYQHTAAIRAALMEKYKPSTANHQGTDAAAWPCIGLWRNLSADGRVWTR